MAVFTPLTQAEIEELLSAYNVGDLVEYRGIAEGVENTNFFLHTTKDRYILTIYEKRVRKDDLPFFLSLMQHCATQGIYCPLPIADKQGKLLQDIKGKPATIISFLQGSSTSTITVESVGALGKGLALFHTASQSFSHQRHNNFGIDVWPVMLNHLNTSLNEIVPGLYQECVQYLDDIMSSWPKALPQGIVHADLFPDNVFFQDGQLTGMIDFYFACTDFFAYDLMICLNSWCFDTSSTLNLDKVTSLIEHYHHTRPLTDEEWHALPILARGAALRFLLTRAQDWLSRPDGALVTPKDPRDYLERLRYFTREGLAFETLRC